MNTGQDKIYTLKELQKILTHKQRIFCHEYIVDWNATRSAKVAGYSDKTAFNIGAENVRKPYIQQYINYIKDDIEKEAGITKLRNVKELQKLAFSSIAHLHNTWIELTEFESLTQDQKDSIESIETKTENKSCNDETIEVKYVKIKLYSKQAALTELNKMLGYNAAEKIESKNVNEYTLRVIDVSNKQKE